MTSEDIARLRGHLDPTPRTHWDSCVWEHPLCGLSWALDEVELLRAALALAVGELSTHGEYAAWSPEMLMNQFVDEARGG